MLDEIQKALSADLNEDQVKEVEAKLSDEGKKQLRELLAIKAQRKAEEKRLEDAKSGNKAEEDRKKKEKEDAEKASTEARNTEISKAKAKFFEEYKIPPEEQVKYSDVEFKKHDSGQTNLDGIVKDFVKVYGSLNAESLVETQKKAEAAKIEREKQAAIDTANAARSNSNPPAGQQPPKFSPEVEKIAKESNITLEAASKIATEGRHRVI